MRVVAGEVKGFELKAPKGQNTRPTSDKVRGAIFDILRETVVDARVVDFYAGTGAMAIEALSRGASEAILVEWQRDACSAIQANLEKTRLRDKATLLCMPVSRALVKLGGTFDLAILDPPYASDEIESIMEVIGAGRLIRPGGTVVLEHGKRFASAEFYGCLERRQVRRYGDTAVSLYEWPRSSRMPSRNH